MAKRRVMIVEDDHSVLKMLRFRLEYEGFSVLEAMDGEEAIQVVEAQRPIDLVLLDVKLPKRDGYEVCRWLKGNPSTADIPVIVLTGVETEIQRLADRCVEVGADDWIQKPLRTQDLLAKIHRVLDRREEGFHGEEDTDPAGGR
jgi:DNA-binding response OmpR family regulator